MAGSTLFFLEFARTQQAGDPFSFQFAPQDYTLRAEGGAVETVRIDWNQQLLDDLTAVRLPGRDPALVAALGLKLAAMLKSAIWHSYESQILAAAQAAAQSAGSGFGAPTFVLTIRSAAAEIYALPWELLTLRDSGQHLGELGNVFIRYEWPTSTIPPAESGAANEPGRILFAWSSASGAVPASEHQAAILRAAEEGFWPFLPERDILAHASPGRLTAALQAAQRSGTPISVLHILCHGVASGGTFALSLDGEQPGDAAVRVDAARLRQLLAPYAGMVRLIVLMACDSGNSGALGNQVGSIAQTLHRSGFAQVVASRFPLSVSGSIRFAETFYTELLCSLKSVEQALLRTRMELALDPEELDWAGVQLYAQSAAGADSRPICFRPYRGLLSFLPEHRRFFFGRDREIGEILERLRALRASAQPRLLAVDGASGSGKSSVVMAGAASGLLKLLGEGATLLVRRLGSEPHKALAELPAARPILLIIDQFEELFSHTEETREGREQRTEFARRLWSLATGTADISVVLTVRSDFMGRCGELLLEDGQRLDGILYKTEHRVSIAQLGRSALREIIERPAALVGLELQAGLSERMLLDVEAEPGALPLLADTLDALWLKRHGRTLTQEAYDALGGIAGTLTGRAEQIISSLHADELRTARRLLTRLVAIGEEGGQWTRQRVKLDEARPAHNDAEAARFDAVLGRLTDARLLVRGRVNAAGDEAVEVAHEALLRRWRRLGDWLDEDRQWLRLKQRILGWAQEFVEHRTLLRGHQLSAALDWAQGRMDDLSAHARELLSASQAAQVREEEEARLARDSRRILAAEQVDFDPTRAAMLLREVESPDPTRISGWLARVYQILQREVLTRCELLGHTGSIKRVHMSPDGTWIATSAEDGTLRLWNAATSALEKTLPLPGGPALDLCFDSDSQALAVAIAGADNTVKVFTLTIGQEGLLPGRSISHHAAVLCAQFSADGRALATGDGGGEVLLSAVATKEEPVPLGASGKGKSAAHRGEVTALCFSPRGDCLVTAGRDGRVRLFDLKRKEPPRALLSISQTDDPDEDEDEDTSDVLALAFHPDGVHIAIGQAEGGVRVVRRDGKGTPLYLDGHEYRVTSLRFSGDGRLLCSTSTDGDAALWGFFATRRTARLWGHRGDVNYATFSDDSNQLITVGGDAVVRIWDLLREEFDQAGHLAEKEAPPNGFVRCFWRRDSDMDQGYRKLLRVAKSRDGQRLAKADATGAVAVTHQGKPFASLPQEGGAVTALGFSPDGNRLAVARQDRLIRLWDLSGGGVKVLSGHHDECYSLDFSPDGRLLGTASLDFTVRLWRADDSGALLRVLTHNAAATLVLFHPSGQRVVTASESEGLWLWELDGTRLPLIHPDREEYCLAVRKDLGACIVQDNELDSEEPDDIERFVWPLDLDPKSLIDRLWRATPICLSVEERRQYLGETKEVAEKNYQQSLLRVRGTAPAPTREVRTPPPAMSWDGEDEDE